MRTTSSITVASSSTDDGFHEYQQEEGVDGAIAVVGAAVLALLLTLVPARVALVALYIVVLLSSRTSSNSTTRTIIRLYLLELILIWHKNVILVQVHMQVGSKRFSEDYFEIDCTHGPSERKLSWKLQTKKLKTQKKRCEINCFGSLGSCEAIFSII